MNHLTDAALEAIKKDAEQGVAPGMGDVQLMVAQIRRLTASGKNLLVERQSLAHLLKRFVDGEHDQGENQSERHIYHDEAEALLAYLGGEVQGHTLVPDHLLRAEHEKKEALLADAELFRWLADQCGEEFQLEVTGIGADGKEVRRALGYEGEADLRQAIQAAMLEDRAVATRFANKENVSRHKEW